MKKLTVKDITLFAMMLAVIEVSKLALSFLPNIELTTFWIIIFTLFFKERIIPVIPAFILIEGVIYGFGLWWFMYLYIWPFLALMTYLFRKNKSVIFWSVFSSVFGFLFGFLCSFPYIIIGALEGGIKNGITYAFSWWVAGIPWDIIHGVGNFFLMLALYVPIIKVTEKLSKKFFADKKD